MRGVLQLLTDLETNLDAAGFVLRVCIIVIRRSIFSLQKETLSEYILPRECVFNAHKSYHYIDFPGFRNCMAFYR